ncbi:MAG: hypothetical protein EZS28_021731, partial [Streblomastix strix]
QSDEKISRCGSKALGDLIEENEIIRHSLLSTGFAQIVLHILSLGTLTQQSFSSSSTSSSSSQTDSLVPLHVKYGVLNVLFKFVTTAEGLEPLSILIPILEQMKTNEEQELKNKAIKIVGQLQIEGITAFSSSSSKEKDEKIQSLEEVNKHKDEEILREQQEKERINQELLSERQEKEKERKRANEAESKILILEQEKNILNQENSKFKENQQEIKIQSPQDLPVTIINSDPTNYSFVDNGGKKQINKNQQNYSAISLTQVMENGIFSLDGKFSSNEEWGCIGIVQDSYSIPAGANPNKSPQQEHLVTYHGPYHGGGTVSCKGKTVSGNKPIPCSNTVRAEYDSEKGTLIYFVNSVQQPVYVTGIKEKVRFIIQMYSVGTSFTDISLKKLSTPTSDHVENEQAVQW